ncbi:MAG: asparagine--tRNA ligase [Nitrospinota bacterium]
MNYVSISTIGKHEGDEVFIRGWVYNKRSSGKIKFLIVRDGTGMIQGVLVKGEVDHKYFDLFERLTQESSIVVRGRVREDRRAIGGYEIDITTLEILQIAGEYPVSPKEHGTEFLMDHRHLWIRSKRQFAILRIRNDIVNAIRDYFNSNGFVLIDAPIFTPAACEGTTTLFETSYFDDKAYLTQSGQLYMEAAAMAFGKVYCFGPTFRAEKSKTRRHLTEFWMVEPEVAFMDLNGDMELAEDFIEYIVQRTLGNMGNELRILERDTSTLENVRKPFPRISYDEAFNILKKEKSDIVWGDDLGANDETTLSNKFDKPVFIHRFPATCKAFYMKSDPDNEKLSLSVDMLAPEGYGEIIGGGEREDDLAKLLSKIKGHNLPVETLNWYLDLRRYGSVLHAGFGLGLERIVAWICGISHVRETIPFPRLINRLTP